MSNPMNEFISETYTETDGYLEHYGRLGMKWYQHIYGDVDGRAKYFEKGVGKISKAEQTKVKNEAKASTNKAKYDAYRSKANILKRKGKDERAEKFRNKADKAQQVYYKAQKEADKSSVTISKTQRFLNKYMSDVEFDNIDPEVLDIGRRYSLTAITELDRKRRAA